MDSEAGLLYAQPWIALTGKIQFKSVFQVDLFLSLPFVDALESQQSLSNGSIQIIINKPKETWDYKGIYAVMCHFDTTAKTNLRKLFSF